MRGWTSKLASPPLRVYLGATLAIPGPGAYRRDLLRLALFKRKGRLPRGERRPVDPDLGRNLASDPGEAAALQQRLDAGRLVCAAVNTPECVWLPRGLLPEVRKLSPLEIIDRRLAFEPLDFRWRSSLVPPQWRAVESVLKQGGGMLQATTGGGKTRMACAVAACLHQPVAWLVHRKDLLLQARADMLRLWNLPDKAIGMVGDDADWLGTHATVAMVQSLVSRPKRMLQVAERVGLVVVDESHHQPSTTWIEVMSNFPAAYRLGLTGTLDRPDGLGPLAMAVLGPGYTEVDQEALVASGLVIIPQVQMIDTGYQHSGSRSWAVLQQSRAKDWHRNAVIASLVLAERKRGGRVAISVALREHAQVVEEVLRTQYGVPAMAILGTTPTEVRERAYADVAAGRLVIIATQLFDEGVNLPELDAMVAAAQGRSPVQAAQRMGRLMRNWKGKARPRFYDLCDMSVPVLADQARERYRLYQERGWLVKRHGP